MKKKLRIISILTASLIFGISCDSSKEKDKNPQKTTKEVVEKTSNEKKTAPQTKTMKKAENTTAVATKSSETKKVADKASKSTSEKKPASTPEKASTSKFVEGKHYVRISPEMQTDSPAGKVEIIELMWLGCGHCYNLEPTMLKYKRNHPDFVEFKQIPATLNRSWTADAKTYFLADILDPTGKKELITQIFQAIHEQRRRLRSPDAVLRLFKQFGYTEKQVKDVQNSMAFKAKLKRAQEISDASKADSVPTVIINGKYRTSVYMTGSEENLLAVMKELSEKELKK